MKVLIACERFGVTRDAFLMAGHDAMSCDLVDTVIPGPHYKGDVRDILNEGWDLMITHPDCTYLTNSAAWAYKDGPYHQKVKPGTLVGAERRAARVEALDFVRLLMAAPIPRIAIENPVGVISTSIKKPNQYIQPYEYGDDASKKTGLWLTNLPKLVPTKFVPPRLVCSSCGTVFPYGGECCPKCSGTKYLPRWSNQTNSGQNKLSPGEGRAMERAKTYSGWADAMVKQWGGYEK